MGLEGDPAKKFEEKISAKKVPLVVPEALASNARSASLKVLLKTYCPVLFVRTGFL